MNTDWRNDEAVQQAARNLFVGVVPERREELESFWEQYDLQFNVLKDLTEDGPFILDAGQYKNIRFNHRAMRAFWLAGFIAWEGYQSIHSCLMTGTKDFQRFSEMIDVFFCILEEDDSALVPAYSDPSRPLIPTGIRPLFCAVSESVADIPRHEGRRSAVSGSARIPTQVLLHLRYRAPSIFMGGAADASGASDDANDQRPIATQRDVPAQPPEDVAEVACFSPAILRRGSWVRAPASSS